MKKRAAIAYVLLAGILWGGMGVFVRRLNAFGIYAIEVMQLRITLSAVVIGGYMLLFERKKFRIRLRDLWCFVCTGVLSMLGMQWCYFRGMQIASLSVMSVLLYTAPVFVMLLSAILFHERLTKLKLAALLMALAGCCLVSGIGSDTALSARGLLLGIGSGLFYGLYSVFGRFAIDRGYSTWTILFYSFLFCAVGCAFLTDWQLLAQTFAAEPTLWLWSAALAVFSGFLPFLFYTKGLEGMEAGRASILASVEPVVASLIGTFVFSEAMQVQGVIGVVLVIGAIVVLSLPGRRPTRAPR